MSNEHHGTDGSGDGMGDTTRVGTAEREKAVALLGEHWRAGRLDPAEHELRVTRARAAVTRGDLDILFADLPSSAAGPAAELEPTGAVADGNPRRFLDRKRDTIIALTPFAALILFFVSGSWLWFLMIPVMGILLYGPEGKKKSGQRGPRGP
jgi:hypothetical protein